MKLPILILSFSLLLVGQKNLSLVALGQSVRPIGVVQAIDRAARRIIIKSDAGPEMTITFEEVARFVRVAPGAKDLENAVTIAASDLAIGDRILARGRSGSDSSSFMATSIIVMSKADIAKKNAAERAEWDRRGVGGVIATLNPASREITINAPNTTGAKPIVVAFANNAVLRRYAANSVKFSDALPSQFEELRVGDQIRALGTVNEDRTRFTAEELVSGSFRTIAGTVVELDAAKSIILITDLATSKRVQVQLTPDSTLRRLSAQLAQMLAARNQGTGSPAALFGSAERDRSRATSSVSSENDSMKRGPKDVQSTIERLPPLGLVDLKVGEALILSCTNSADPSHVTAITLLAGVEPLLRDSSRGGKSLNLGSWNLDLNMNVGLP